MWCILPVCRVRVAYTLVRTQCGGSVFGFRDLLWVSVGQYFIFGALYPSKSGLMNKHIVNHIVRGKFGRLFVRFVSNAVFHFKG